MKALNNRFLVYAVLVLTSVIFAITRSAELLSRNFIFILDQGRDYVFVSDIVTNHKITLIGSEVGGGYAGVQGIFQGPAHFYLLSIFYILFGGDPYGGVVYMFLFAILACFVGFFVGSKIFNNMSGALLALLIALSPPLIAQAKFVWNPYPITVFIILFFFCIYRMQKHDLKFIFFAGLICSFTYNFELAITIPLTISLILYSICVARLKTIKQYLTLAVGLLVGASPFVFFEARHGFIATNGFIKYFTHISSPTNEKYGLVNNHLDAFFNSIINTFPPLPIALSIGICIFILVATVYLLKYEKKKEIKNLVYFLGILLIVSILIFSLIRNYLFPYYLYHMNVVYIFIVTYVFYASFTQKRKILLYPLILIFLLFIYIGLTKGIQDFKNDTTDVNAYQKIKAKTAAIDYIYKDAKGAPFSLFVFAPTVYTYPYDYIVKWYGQKKYKYLPGNTKEGIFYLLIEKDPDQPWTYKGWLETIIKNGKILKTTTLPSGLIIQKRISPELK